MALNDAGMALAANGLRTGLAYAQLYTGTTNAGGTTALTAAARQPVVWGAASGNGDFSNSAAVNFTGGAASGPATRIGYWSAVTGGTFYGDYPLTGDQTFNAAGEYTCPVGILSFDGSAS